MVVRRSVMDQDLSSDLSFHCRDEDAQLVSVPARVNRSDENNDALVVPHPKMGLGTRSRRLNAPKTWPMIGDRRVAMPVSKTVLFRDLLCLPLLGEAILMNAKW
jgi:hypothetical protein